MDECSSAIKEDENGCGENCTENDALQILQQFECLYQSKVEELDARKDIDDVQRNKGKLQIMSEWIRDLGDQNLMLVQTVHGLEQAAVCRVKLLEDKLQDTTNIISQNMAHSRNSEEDLDALSNRVGQLVDDQEHMQCKIKYLQNDIGSLLALIKKGRLENNWSLDGLEFCEIRPSDILEVIGCAQQKVIMNVDYCRAKETNENIDKLILNRNELEFKVTELTKKISTKENIISRYACEIKSLRDSLLENCSNSQKKFNKYSCVETNICSADDKKKSLQIENLQKQLKNSEAKIKDIMHEYESRIYNIENCLKKKTDQNKDLCERLEHLRKEASEERNSLAREVAEKHDTISLLKKELADYKERLQNAMTAAQRKEKIICEQNNLETAGQRVVTPVRQVSINELCQNMEDNAVKERLCDNMSQIKDLKRLVDIKNNEISRLKKECTKKSQLHNETDESYSGSQCDLLPYLVDFVTSEEKQKEDLCTLKKEFLSVIENLNQTENMYKNDVTLTSENLEDILACLHEFIDEVKERDNYANISRDFIISIENKISNVHKLFQNECEVCVEENLILKLREIISKVTPGISKLSEMYESKIKSISTIKSVIQEQKSLSQKYSNQEKEQKAISAAIIQQFRMMEEFRICTVEVQAATEDLREEISEVIRNFNARHCKFKELNKIIIRVQEYFLNTKDYALQMINCVQLQNEDRARYNKRISNNKIRLKDLKNEFNQTQLEYQKSLDNTQQNSLLSYSNVHTCNDLLAALMEEAEQIVTNLQLIQSNDSNTVSKISELNLYLVNTNKNIEEIKNEVNQTLIDSEAAQESFSENEKLLEKYEREIDICQTKMQDTLESIIEIREQMNDYGLIKECADRHQSTNDFIKLKVDLRKMEKECATLKHKLSKAPEAIENSETASEWRERAIALQDQIKVLQSECKCKQTANVHLKRSLEVLENELDFLQVKSEEYRRSSSSECFELKKKVFELENSLRAQKDKENNFKPLVNCNSRKPKLIEITDKDNALRKESQEKHENVTLVFKVLQEVMQSINKGLQEFSNDLKQLAPEGSFHSYTFNHLVKTILERLNRQIESIKDCYYKMEKVKSDFHTKETIMKNMDKIIQIQKNSITLSQSEVGDLQEKLQFQEREIMQHEKEKIQLNREIELQAQTNVHLQEAMVEANHTIDQLINKSSDENEVIEAMNLYLMETQKQFNECFEEASKQEALLETQRDSINDLQKKITSLKNEKTLDAFILHLAYCIIIHEYQEELKSCVGILVVLKSKMKELVCDKNYFENQCRELYSKYEKAQQETDLLRDSFEEYKKSSTDKVKAMSTKNEELKHHINSYESDYDLIENEMKKIGLVDSSIPSFIMEIESMRYENEQFRCDTVRYKKTIKDLKMANECLTKALYDFKIGKDAACERFKEKIIRLQNELASKHEKNTSLNTRVKLNETIISEQLNVIKEQSGKIIGHELSIKEVFSDLNSSKEMVAFLKSHIDSFKSVLKDNSEIISKLKGENQILKNSNDLFATELSLQERKAKNEICLLDQQLKHVEAQLADVQKNYESVLQESNRDKEHIIKLSAKEASAEQSQIAINRIFESCKCNVQNIEEEFNKSQDQVNKLNRELEDIREKHSFKTLMLNETQEKLNGLSSKYENLERCNQRQKDELLLLEKRVTCSNQKLKICMDKNEELLRQNKGLDDTNSKSLEELEDIVLQLEDMQSSLVELRNECDKKTESLNTVSLELERMKVSRLEVCDESNYVLQWVRHWLREQKQITNSLRDEVANSHKHLKRINSEKKKLKFSLRRLKRINKIFARRLKPRRRQRHFDSVSDASFKKSVKSENGNNSTLSPICLSQPESKIAYTLFRKECNDRQNYAVDKLKTKGNYSWFPSLEYLSKLHVRNMKTNCQNIQNEQKTLAAIDC